MHPLLQFAINRVQVTRGYPNKWYAIYYLEESCRHLEWEANTYHVYRNYLVEARIFIEMHIANLKLELGKLQECKNLFVEAEKSILNCRDSKVDHIVYGCYYWFRSQYHKYFDEYDEFYKSALQFWVYDPIPRDELLQRFLAYNLAISALLGNDIYNFREIFAYPIIKKLEASNDVCWLYEILEAFSTGNLNLYREKREIYSDVFNAQSALVRNESKLVEKINLLCIMEYIYSCPSDENITRPLSEIATRTGISVEDVKKLLEKGILVGLIEGQFDKDGVTVHVSWVRPRDLGIPRVKSLGDQPRKEVYTANRMFFA